MFGKLLFTGILSPHGKYPYKLKSKGVRVNFKSDFYENTHSLHVKPGAMEK